MKIKHLLIICMIVFGLFIVEIKNQKFYSNQCGGHTKSNSKCVGEPPVDLIEKIASESLTIQDKLYIEEGYEKGKVKKSRITREKASLVDERFDGMEVFEVTYKSKQEVIFGDIVIYVDGKTKKVIGRGIME